MDSFFGIILLIALLAMVWGLRRRMDNLATTLKLIEWRLGESALAPAPLPAEGPAAESRPQAEPQTTETWTRAERRSDETSDVIVSPAETPMPATRDIAPEPAPVAFVREDFVPEIPEAEADAEAEPEAQAPRPRRDYGDLEKRFGTQWVVWVGGLALALGGIFLVRYSIEQGIFGPGLRVALGGVLALILIGLGELARRREIIAGLAELPRAHIPSILTAAGTIVAYADVWAAYALYEFLSPGLAFVLLGLVALATLAAALVHGPSLAGLGLVGAYITPALVSSQQPSFWALYAYLAIVTAAAYALARVRLWTWLAVTAAILSIIWMFLKIADPSAVAPHAFHALTGFALAAAFLVPGLLYGPGTERGHADPLSSGILSGYLFGTLLMVLLTRHDTTALVTLAVLIAATAAIAWRAEAAIIAVPVAAAFGLLVIVHWVTALHFDSLYAPGGLLSDFPFELHLQGVSLHVAFGTGLAALFGAAGYLSQGRSEQPAFPVIWAATGVLTPVIVLVAFYYRFSEFDRSLPFAALALLLAAAFWFAVDHLSKRDVRPGTASAAALYACGTVAALALALTFALEKGWLTVSLALMVPGIAYIADKRPLPMLRTLCGIVVALVMARVAWNPRIVGGDLGTMPILNWILYGYGIPELCFWIGGYLLRRRADDIPARSVDSAAILFTALTAFLEIRHLMNDGDIYRPAIGLGELGLQISTGLAMVIGMEHVRGRGSSLVHDYAARIFGLLTFAGIVVGLGFKENPLLTGDPVGGPVFNYILLGYGIPAVLAGILARMIRTTRPRGVYIGAAVTAIVLMMAYLTLEVRTIFQGPVLTGGRVSDAEDYTYSAVWLAFGVVLLLGGIALKSQPARLASAAIVVLTIAKVFLHDLAGVQGIYRAFSFICLGLVLIGIGWLYQRLLFPPRRAGDPAHTTPSTA
jgi:uncharacterized membrane protein